MVYPPGAGIVRGAKAQYLIRRFESFPPHIEECRQRARQERRDKAGAI